MGEHRHKHFFRIDTKYPTKWAREPGLVFKCATCSDRRYFTRNHIRAFQEGRLPTLAEMIL